MSRTHFLVHEGVLLLSAMLVAGCEVRKEPPTMDEDPATVMAAIHDAERAQIAAINQGDLKGAVANYAPGATVWTPGEHGVSGEGIDAFFTRAFNDEAFDVVLNEGSQTQLVSQAGDIVITSFTGMWTYTGPSGVVTEPLFNQTIWQRQEDQTYKVISDVNTVFEPTTELVPAD